MTLTIGIEYRKKGRDAGIYLKLFIPQKNGHFLIYFRQTLMAWHPLGYGLYSKFNLKG